jgi:hypothetical protein
MWGTVFRNDYDALIIREIIKITGQIDNDISNWKIYRKRSKDCVSSLSFQQYLNN